MKLDEFKALVDAAPTPVVRTPTRYDAVDEKTSLAEIRRCFTLRESDQARSAIRSIINALGLRHLCDQAPCEPYSDVASALQQALRERGDSNAPASDWQNAVELARRHAAMYPSGLPADQQWVSNVEVCTLSAAVSGLRAKGYRIDLPETGDVDVPRATTSKLAADIDSGAASLGNALAFSAAYNISMHYRTVLGRYDLGRPPKTVLLNAKPQLPLAYLYQLGLRYFELAPSAKNPEAALGELCELVSLATALLDLTSTVYDTLFARSTEVISILQKSAVYDSVFLVAQAKPAHAREYLSWTLTNEALAKRTDKEGRTAAEIHRLALMLLEEAQSADTQDFKVIDPKKAANALGIPNVSAANKLLTDVFAHTKGANQKLTFPPKDTDVDAAFRPLLLLSGKLVMQPGPLAARAVVNAALDWCKRKAWPTKRFDDEALGPLLEQFVRERLAARGVVVHRGRYSHGAAEGECDAVVETQKEIIFLELKSKMLTREARAGDDVKALADLSQALVRPQAQAMERHAVLVENGTLTLTADGASHDLQLGGREVFKVSLTRGDMGSLHDRVFIGLFMKLGCVCTFTAMDAVRQSELDELHRQFRKLKSSADQAKDAYLDTTFPFSSSWSLSVYHLLMLLEGTTDSESFSRELQRTRRMVTPRKDFYVENAFALDLEKHGAVAQKS